MSAAFDDLRVYSPAPWVLDRDRTYDHTRRSLHKPKGLWVSSGDDWERWCRDDDYGWPEGHQCVTQIVVDESDTILVLDSVAAIDDFTTQHGVGAGAHSTLIDWSLIAALYDGIVITPYQWERRLDGAASSWYYGWDCASGCIWNLDLIVAVRPLVSETAS